MKSYIFFKVSNKPWGTLTLPLTDRVRRSLQEFGLTDYEIRSYSSLLEIGPATASELSEASDVPYSKIYEILGSLEKKGWIESEHGRPSKYYPKPPSLAIEITKSQFENKLKTNEALVLDELQPLYEKKGVREHPDIWIVRGNCRPMRPPQYPRRAEEEQIDGHV